MFCTQNAVQMLNNIISSSTSSVIIFQKKKWRVSFLETATVIITASKQGGTQYKWLYIDADSLGKDTHAVVHRNHSNTLPVLQKYKSSEVRQIQEATKA